MRSRTEAPAASRSGPPNASTLTPGRRRFSAVTTAAAELQTAGEAAGLDAQDVFWMLARLAPLLEPRRGGFVDGRHQPTLFALRDLHKDLDLALDVFRRSAADVPLTTLVRGLVDEAMPTGADLDITAVTARYRRADATVGA